MRTIYTADQCGSVESRVTLCTREADSRDSCRTALCCFVVQTECTRRAHACSREPVGRAACAERDCALHACWQAAADETVAEIQSQGEKAAAFQADLAKVLEACA